MYIVLVILSFLLSVLFIVIYFLLSFFFLSPCSDLTLSARDWESRCNYCVYIFRIYIHAVFSSLGASASLLLLLLLLSIISFFPFVFSVVVVRSSIKILNSRTHLYTTTNNWRRGTSSLLHLHSSSSATYIYLHIYTYKQKKKRFFVLFFFFVSLHFNCLQNSIFNYY
jgi:hypothetical protein